MKKVFKPITEAAKQTTKPILLKEGEFTKTMHKIDHTTKLIQRRPFGSGL